MMKEASFCNSRFMSCLLAKRTNNVFLARPLLFRFFVNVQPLEFLGLAQCLGCFLSCFFHCHHIASPVLVNVDESPSALIDMLDHISDEGRLLFSVFGVDLAIFFL